MKKVPISHLNPAVENEFSPAPTGSPPEIQSRKSSENWASHKQISTSAPESSLTTASGKGSSMPTSRAPSPTPADARIGFAVNLLDRDRDLVVSLMHCAGLHQSSNFATWMYERYIYLGRLPDPINGGVVHFWSQANTDWNELRNIIRDAMKPLGGNETVKLIAKCFSLTRGANGEDLALTISALKDELANYPADLVEYALTEWPRISKWRPALMDLVELMHQKGHYRLDLARKILV